MTGLGRLVASILAVFGGFFPYVSAERVAPLPLPILHPAPQVTVLFGGDMMFDRTIRTTIDEKGGDFIFSCIDPTLQSADLVVANLEGPITATSSRSVGSAVGAPDNFTFTFPSSTAELLRAHHIRIVNIGNNHILNFGNDGVRSTISALTSAGVGYFGDPLSATVAAGSFDGVPLAFINYNEFVNHGEASTTLSQIREARAAGQIPIVYTHWGVEYATTSPERIHTLAHEFVDAGAAIVIGSHPHVVEEHEMYNGVPIYYSLGNFIFDQYWNDDVRHGLLLRVTVTAQGVGALEEIPVELEHDRRTCAVE
jgi:poly-gamma-glutamate capsule biosynthesis protein CapA/YwtB (metallophosphatase superfamily)